MARARPILAIMDLSMPGWTAAASYTESLVRSLVLAGAADEFALVTICSQNGPSAWAQELGIRAHGISVDWPSHTRSSMARRVGGLLGPGSTLAARLAASVLLRAKGDHLAFEVDRLGASVLLPIVRPLRGGTFRKLGWIPDFQHVHQPENFDAADRAARDEAFRGVAETCDRVILSSTWAKEHFQAFAPEHARKALLAPFPSLFAFRPLPETTGSAVAKYRLPSRFALVANQMWKHKNHAVVVEAVAIARARGVDVPVVMIGSPSDYRDPTNQNISSLLQQIAARGVHDLVHVLGGVPRDDLVDLTRCASLCIQPSRFEGWSTTVEDAKALGRPLVCSDLPVHREQVPHGSGFFGCDEPEALAELLIAAWSEPVRATAEPRAVADERIVAATFGTSLLAACRELAAARNT